MAISNLLLCFYFAEGKGSLLYFLKAKGWASSLSAGVGSGGSQRSSYAYIFEMSIRLTDSGLKNVCRLSSVFLYVHILDGRSSILYSECFILFFIKYYIFNSINLWQQGSNEKYSLKYLICRRNIEINLFLKNWMQRSAANVFTQVIFILFNFALAFATNFYAEENHLVSSYTCLFHLYLLNLFG